LLGWRSYVGNYSGLFGEIAGYKFPKLLVSSIVRNPGV
jgi:hypothetical protein